MRPGCQLLFSLPFAAIGGAACVYSWRIAGAEEPDWEQIVGMAYFGGLFVFAGATVFGLAIYGAIKERGRAKLAREHPDEMWKWRRDWAEGRIASQSGGYAIATWLLAIFWNYLCLIVPFLIWSEITTKGNYWIVLTLVFPAIGIYFLYRAGVKALQWGRYGDSILEVETLPARRGGMFRGKLKVKRRLADDARYRVRLSCIHHYSTSTGRNRTSRSDVLYRDEYETQSERSDDAFGWRTVPIEFKLPTEWPETSSPFASSRKYWSIQVDASTPGVDYEAAFEVPVFGMASEGESAEAEAFRSAAPATGRTSEARAAAAEEAGIVIRDLGGGASEIKLARARNRAPAIAVSILFGLVACAYFFLMIPMGSLIPILLGFAMVAGLGVAVVQVALQETRVQVGQDRLRIVNTALGLKREHEIAAEDVASVYTRVGMQMGDTVFRNVMVKDRSGRQHVVASGVANQHVAESVERKLKRGLGLSDEDGQSAAKSIARRP